MTSTNLLTEALFVIAPNGNNPSRVESINCGTSHVWSPGQWVFSKRQHQRPLMLSGPTSDLVTREVRPGLLQQDFT